MADLQAIFPVHPVRTIHTGGVPQMGKSAPSQLMIRVQHRAGDVALDVRARDLGLRLVLHSLLG